jgi:two-component system, sensor histidine kinase and response regulator
VIGKTTITNRKEATSLLQKDTAACRPLSVLVVEDNPANRKVIALMLRKRGYRVTVADSGREALKLFMSGRFNAVLMDIEMPVMNGYQTAAVIRRKELPCDARTPIIALTAHLLDRDHHEWTDAGMDAYLTKPFDIDQLISLLESITNRETRNDGNVGVQTSANPDAAGNDHLEPAIDFAAIMRRLENDRELFHNFVEIFDEDAPKLLESILSAAACEDSTTIRRAAHTLRGLASNFDAKALTESACRLELAEADELNSQGELLDNLSHEFARVKEALSSYR